MKLKYIFASTFLLLSGIVLANTSSQLMGYQDYHCSATPTQNHDLAWCSCYEIYLETTCKNQGGSDSNCTDASMRQMIEEFGGPNSVCSIFPNPDMNQSMCVQTLTYYLKQC